MLKHQQVQILPENNPQWGQGQGKTHEFWSKLIAKLIYKQSSHSLAGRRAKITQYACWRLNNKVEVSSLRWWESGGKGFLLQGDSRLISQLESSQCISITCILSVSQTPVNEGLWNYSILKPKLILLQANVSKHLYRSFQWLHIKVLWRTSLEEQTFHKHIRMPLL